MGRTRGLQPARTFIRQVGLMPCFVTARTEASGSAFTNGTPAPPHSLSTSDGGATGVSSKQRGRRRGTTIIEVVTAIVILSLALPPLVMAFAEASIQTIHPYNASVAAFLAIERMEQIVAERYSGGSGYESVLDDASASAPVNGFPGFSRRVDVTPYTVGAGMRYAKVRVEVTWNNGGNQVAVERLFTDY